MNRAVAVLQPGTERLLNGLFHRRRPWQQVARGDEHAQAAQPEAGVALGGGAKDQNPLQRSLAGSEDQRGDELDLMNL